MSLFKNFLICTIITRISAQSCWRNTTCSHISQPAFPGLWDSNIYAPLSRTVSPKFVLDKNGKQISTYPGSNILAKNGSILVFDFGIEVGGLVSLQYTVSGNGPGAIGLAFSEAKNYIGVNSDSSNGHDDPDGAIYSNFSGPGSVDYKMPDHLLRGGFRYLTLFLMSDTVAIMITNVSLEIGFMPTWSNLRAYQGYFHCDDETLNKIWYSGAYTLQTNAVPVNTGRKMMHYGWTNDGLLGPGQTIIVDGAKRDRAVWPGDMGIAAPSTFVSIGELYSIRNALQTMYEHQNADGSFPEAGPPLLQQGSDTYHMWTMIGTYNYILYTNDTEFLSRNGSENWNKYQKAMTYIYGKVKSPGLLDVTGTRDWARFQTKGNVTEAQMILYRTVITGSSLATWVGDTTGLSTKWSAQARSLQLAVLTYMWDSTYGAFKDNATSTSLHPQDANSMAVLFGVVDRNSSFAERISSSLTQNWTPIGPVSPELPDNISPFITSFEIQAHFIAGQAQRGLDLIRTTWGWYLNHPNGTGSTVIEGYLKDGTFGYRYNRGYPNPSYTSHSHGWSSGPTSALTNFVLGLSITAPVGSTWQFAPNFGNLTRAEGGFTTKLGKFQASWKKDNSNYHATLTTPMSTAGEMILPVFTLGHIPRVVLDGDVVVPTWYTQPYTVLIPNVNGGNHTIDVN